MLRTQHTWVLCSRWSNNKGLFLISGTSNWSGDYFVSTAGSALVVNQTSSLSSETTVQSQLKAVFERDWSSAYSTPLNQHSNAKDLCH